MSLGHAIFDRIGKTLSLTDTGEQLVIPANQIINISQQIIQLGSTSHIIPATIRIGTFESLTSPTLIPLLTSLQNLYSHLKLVVSTASSYILCDMLSKRFNTKSALESI